MSKSINNVTGYINAGGKGTRLNSVFKVHKKRGITKAFLPIGKPSIPLVEHQINKLINAGISPIVVGVGFHKNVQIHVDKKYKNQKNIHAITFTDQLGTGGDLLRAFRKNKALFKGYVLILNVDTLLDINETDFLDSHRLNGGEITIALTLNKNVPNEGAFYVGNDGEVIYCAESTNNVIAESAAAKKCYYRASSTGTLLINKSFLEKIQRKFKSRNLSLYSDITSLAMSKGSLFAFNNRNNLFIDLGTVDTWNYSLDNAQYLIPYIQYKERS
jgi:NDP-sugar pyrophosphorylase family protein